MAIITTTQILEQGPRNLVVHWTGVSDGVGNEDGVLKVDVSTLSPPCGSVKILRVDGNVEFGMVEIYWDALTPVKALELSGDIHLDFCKVGGMVNNAGGGKTGDVLLSTTGFELNSTYDLLIEMIKKQ